MENILFLPNLESSFQKFVNLTMIILIFVNIQVHLTKWIQHVIEGSQIPLAFHSPLLLK